MTTPPPQTLRALAGLPNQPSQLGASALIIIDAQIEYSPNGALPLKGFEQAVENLAVLLTEARASDSMVIHVAHTNSSGHLFQAAHGARIVEPLQPLPGETVINKSLPNSFADTPLNQLLTSGGITDLAIAGFMTHMCVSATARAALDLGYRSSVVADATATRDLPSATDGTVVPAASVQSIALASLADRFSVVTSTAALLAATTGVARRTAVLPSQ